MLTAFEESLFKKGYREGSVKQIMSRLRFLLNHSPFEYEALDAFLLSKYRAGTTGATLCKYVDVIRSFGAFQGLKWVEKISYYKVEETDRGVLSDEEIEFILALPCPKGFRKEVWQKWTFWLKILAFSGMRAGEVSGLTVDQVDFGSNNFILSHTKTIPRRVPIAHNIQADIKQWVQHCETYLFPSKHPSGHIWRQAWNKHFLIRKQFAGIKRKNVTIHSFRHSFITNLLEENVSLSAVQAVVGHKSLETTQKYIHLTNKTAQAAVARHRIVRRSSNPEELLKCFTEEVVRQGLLDDRRFTWQLSESSLHIEIKQKK